MLCSGLRGGFRGWTHHHREAVAVIANRNDFVLRGFQACGGWGSVLLLGTGGEGFLQQGIKGCPRQSMPGDLQKGARKRFASSAPQSGVVLAMFLLVLNCPDEPARDIALGGRLDQGVALLRTMTELLLHVLNPPFEAFQNLLGFLADVSQLPIRKVGHVGHEHLAVIPEREKSWSWTLPVALLPVLA